MKATHAALRSSLPTPVGPPAPDDVYEPRPDCDRRDGHRSGLAGRLQTNICLLSLVNIVCGSNLGVVIRRTAAVFDLIRIYRAAGWLSSEWGGGQRRIRGEEKRAVKAPRRNTGTAGRRPRIHVAETEPDRKERNEKAGKESKQRKSPVAETSWDRNVLSDISAGINFSEGDSSETFTFFSGIEKSNRKSI